MEQERRPDPDQLLNQIEAERREASSARLKLFFGAYPGVGKTYAMLEAAKERKREGMDVVVGIVETHGRPETAALLADLEILPRKEINYKGVAIQEFDLDAALERKPGLLLVDELAHTNAPLSRHTKRWQDIEELLNAGISVYTTLNVQHWESLNDLVAQITGVRVRETVPDSFLRKAHEVELVDLPPADLLKRMSEGKVYMSDQAIRAAENFFQTGNLIALRELALRHTAERVDLQMQEFKSRYAVSRVLPVKERLLVGITASPDSARLIRATLRLATSLRADWITVYVQTPEHQKLPEDQKVRIIDTLRLAERLGGETAVLTGQDVPGELLKYARNRNVTKIVLGKPSQPLWKELLFGSTINRVARHSAEIDLYVISARDVDEQIPKRYPATEKPKREGFLQAGALVALCTALGWMLSHRLDSVNLIMFYLLIVVWSSYRYGRTVGIFASILSVISFDFFLVRPYFTFAVSDTQYFITFAIMLFVAVLISTLTGRLLSLAEATRAREARLGALYRVSRTLSETPNPDAMLHVAWEQLEEFMKVPIAVLIPDASGALQIAAGDEEVFHYVGNERETAEWVFQRGEIAGRGTDTLAGSLGTYIPIKGREKRFGVLGIRFPMEANLIEPEQIQMLEKVSSEIGASMESTELSEAAGRATASMEAERLKNLVLRSFSYDLAEPSKEIYDAAQELRSESQFVKPSVRKSLAVLIEKSDQINRVVARLPQFLQYLFPTPEETGRSDGTIASAFELETSVAGAIPAERIAFFRGDATKNEILETLVRSLNLPNPQEILRSIQEREEVGGILIRPNMAIPHTTIPGFNGVKASLGIQKFNGEQESTWFWLVFVSGADSIKEHLAFLKDVALTFTDETVKELARCTSPADAARVISVNHRDTEAQSVQSSTHISASP